MYVFFAFVSKKNKRMNFRIIIEKMSRHGSVSVEVSTIDNFEEIFFSIKEIRFMKNVNF